jgi:hypothetical protein
MWYVVFLSLHSPRNSTQEVGHKHLNRRSPEKKTREDVNLYTFYSAFQRF